ncbi:MAG: hypothetical protein HY299_02635 [Verrucomicrobia bacterium]|nr:hypothetical protein [Verrucomicrobiota bacterium]
MATERITDRSLYRFAEEVKTQFSFLETSGFRCVRSEATFVRFESPTAGVNVYHGRQSFEIGLEIESASSPTDNYSLSEVLRLVDRKRGERYRNYATHTMQGVAEGVRKLAELFQHCIGILNDKELFLHLRLQRKELAKDYALETQLEQARRKAEAAWRTKDYAAVVEALKPSRAALTETEVAKLEFAEKQCGK